jgi:hypothetical protein
MSLPAPPPGVGEHIHCNGCSGDCTGVPLSTVLAYLRDAKTCIKKAIAGDVFHLATAAYKIDDAIELLSNAITNGASQPPSDVDALMSRVSQLVKSGELELIVSDLDSPGDGRELRYRYHSSVHGEEA